MYRSLAGLPQVDCIYNQEEAVDVTGDPATDLLSDMKTRCKSLPLRSVQTSRGTLCSSAFSSASAGGGHMATLTLVLCSISVPSLALLEVESLHGTLAAVLMAQ